MTMRLQVNPIACTGHGLCADLLPEVIELDEWGYPIIESRIPHGLTAHAKRAVNACPALALKLTQAQERRTRG
jgi:ferredoxin